MSKVKSPNQKKQLAYDREHRTLAERPHLFRKAWPKKKADVERAARHKARQVLESTGDDAAVAEISRQIVRKESSTLREIVAFKKGKRQEMIGAHKARKARRDSEG